MDGRRFRARTVTALACGVTLALAAPAAGQVGLRDDPRAAAVALAGPDVLVARTGRHGSVAVDAVPREGGAVRRVLSVPSPGREWSARPFLAASPRRLALLVLLQGLEGAPEWRLYSGPPAGPVSLDLRVRWTSRRTWMLAGVAVDGEHVLLQELRWAGFRTRASVLAPGTAPALVPWPGIVFVPVAIAGDRIAFLGSDRSGRDAPVDRVFVADWRTGAVAVTLDVGDADDVREEDVDLAADGSVVAADAGRLLTAAPGQAERAVPAAGSLSAPRFAGAAGIAALRGGRFQAERLVVVDPAGGATRPIGAPSTTLQSLDADEHGAAWLANGCVRHARLDGSAVRAQANDPCPAAEVVLEEGDRVLRGRALRILVTCVAGPPHGCRGTALVRDGAVLGRGRFQVPPGSRRRVEVRLTRRGLEHVRRQLRKAGDAFLELDAHVRDGRVGGGAGASGVVIDRRA